MDYLAFKTRELANSSGNAKKCPINFSLADDKLKLIGHCLDGYDFEFRIDFLLQHSLDGHQCAGKRAGTTAARALITNF